ncbi:hypothetical protein POM88_019441 [Heracleum sosnowskyi]|uniref:HAT C-terminal dimerisation domain-containing protein n=1 Tax=Heracleum sosnowskyi TaxID=360622 RepID=A0AAD8MQG2_9APIA|nr:hypothetical protein POM88_019441 [Heracleum sosnowskyi]
MKETGLIPNAVSMLHGLCQDGLVQEAMKLFSLMHETGTIPEVIIYTAVIEGFCKAHKLDDAKRIFRKMQGNGISPNAITYGVLIQGLVHKKSLDDALVFSVEMLEAGHSPNLATFTGLVDCFFNWFFFAINMGALLVYMSCLYVNTSDYICCYYTDPAGAEVKYNTSEDSEDSLPCTRFDETKQLGFTDKVKQNIVEISRKLNVKRLFAPSTNGALYHICDSASKTINKEKRQRRLLENYMQQQQLETTEKKNDVDIYLAEEPLNPMIAQFDILLWWKDNASRYKTLSMIAKDILVIPVSTVASESAFSTSGRILDPFRSSLSPKMLEALVCTQSWLKGSHDGIKSDTYLDETYSY